MALEISIRIQQSTPHFIVTDELRLQQILINLIGNAVKFTHHGEIPIDCEKENENEEQTGLFFAVSDNGCTLDKKIPTEFSNHLNNRVQLSDKEQGTRLGHR